MQFRCWRSRTGARRVILPLMGWGLVLASACADAGKPLAPEDEVIAPFLKNVALDREEVQRLRRAGQGCLLLTPSGTGAWHARAIPRRSLPFVVPPVRGKYHQLGQAPARHIRQLVQLGAGQEIGLECIVPQHFTTTEWVAALQTVDLATWKSLYTDLLVRPARTFPAPLPHEQMQVNWELFGNADGVTSAPNVMLDTSDPCEGTGNIPYNPSRDTILVHRASLQADCWGPLFFTEGAAYGGGGGDYGSSLPEDQALLEVPDEECEFDCVTSMEPPNLTPLDEALCSNENIGCFVKPSKSDSALVRSVISKYLRNPSSITDTAARRWCTMLADTLNYYFGAVPQDTTTLAGKLGGYIFVGANDTVETRNRSHNASSDSRNHVLHVDPHIWASAHSNNVHGSFAINNRKYTVYDFYPKYLLSLLLHEVAHWFKVEHPIYDGQKDAWDAGGRQGAGPIYNSQEPPFQYMSVGNNKGCIKW